jgi:hypothetical protein
MLVIENLRKIPQLAKLTTEQLIELAQVVKPQTIYESQHIVHQGDLGNRLVILVSGVINLRETDSMGTERSVGVLDYSNLGDEVGCIGEQMFTTQEPFAFTALAIRDCEVLILEREQFDAFVAAHPEIGPAIAFVKEAERERTRGYRWVNEGELIAAVVHKHPWMLLTSLRLMAILIVVAAALLGLLTGLRLQGLFYIPALIGLAALGSLFYAVYDWINDEYIVTNRRVVHIERRLWIEELSASIPLDKIQNVRIEKSGLGGWLNVGRLVIQSAAQEGGDVTFAFISDPESIRVLIEEQQEHVRARQEAERRERDRRRIERELREQIMPQEIEKEPPPQRAGQISLTARQVVRSWIGSWLNVEIRSGTNIVWRKHWIVLLQQAKRWLIALVGLDIILGVYALVPGFQVLPRGVHLLLGLVVLVVSLAGLWWEWEDWRNDTYSITDSQVIDAERLPLGLRETSKTALLDQVQNVQVDMPDFWGLALNYGNVMIETAGQGGQMVFRSVRNPRAVADEVFKRLQEYRDRRMEKQASLQDRVVVDALLSYHRLRLTDERLTKERDGAQTTSEPAEPAEAENKSPTEENQPTLYTSIHASDKSGGPLNAPPAAPSGNLPPASPGSPATKQTDSRYRNPYPIISPPASADPKSDVDDSEAASS